MTCPKGLLLMYLSCYVFLATYTTHGAAMLSFDLNFSIPSDRNQLKFFNDSYAVSDRIILTNETSNLTGGVVYGQPVRLWDDRTGKRASFNTSFVFAILGNEELRDNYTRGDGFAFFIGPQLSSLPPDSRSGFLGLFSNPDNTNEPPHTIGVEFDTCRNEKWDPQEKDGNTVDHIGIDINNITSNQTRNLPGKSLYGTMLANIMYDGDSKTMNVTLNLNPSSLISNEHIFKLNATLDLKDELLQEASVGFSAATGPLYESHHLLSWSFHSTDPSPPKKLWVILVSVAGSVIIVGSVATLLICIMQNRRRSTPGTGDIVLPGTGDIVLPGTSDIVLPVARKISYSELVAATDNFPSERKIGTGSFGVVYRGTLSDLREVAVKKLTGTPEASWKDYETEIKTLGQLSHRNLLKLIGWCNNGDELLLVYELMPNRSLDKHLHGHGKTLPWLRRYNILLGIASAIDYLHLRYDAKNYVLHRDIKPSNVMLDDDFETKLGDFGLVRQLSRQPAAGTTGTRTTVIGSLDYIDPVYIETGKLSPASDVYSFGVLLLEVATGRKPSVSQGIEGHQNTLINAVRRCYDRDAILEMADDRLRGDFEQWQMERVMLTGLLCVQMDQQKRPSIKDAIDLLSKREQYPLPQLLE